MKLSLPIVLTGLALGGAARAAPPAADVKAGAALFEDRCAICHQDQGGGQGPGLKGVSGRKAGSVKGFDYTPALKASGLTWTAATLDMFLTNPGKAVPGTAMPIRVGDATQRAALIAYLANRP